MHAIGNRELGIAPLLDQKSPGASLHSHPFGRRELCARAVRPVQGRPASTNKRNRAAYSGVTAVGCGGMTASATMCARAIEAEWKDGWASFLSCCLPKSHCVGERSVNPLSSSDEMQLSSVDAADGHLMTLMLDGLGAAAFCEASVVVAGLCPKAVPVTTTSTHSATGEECMASWVNCRPLDGPTDPTLLCVLAAERKTGGGPGGAGLVVCGLWFVAWRARSAR